MSVNVYDSESKELTRIAGDTLYADAPVGAIISYGGSTAPSGWLLCQGQAISRTTYADLFKAIGTVFGTGDGSTTFNVPDLREATTKGVGLSGKSSNHYDSDGVALGEFINDRLQDHTHAAQIGQSTSSDWAFRADAENKYAGATSGVKNGRFGDTTEVKAVGVNYIIKALQVGIPQNILDSIDSIIESKATHLYLHQIRFRMRTLSEYKQENQYGFDNENNPTKYKIGVIRRGVNYDWRDLWNNDIESLYAQDSYDDDMLTGMNHIEINILTKSSTEIKYIDNIKYEINNDNSRGFFVRKITTNKNTSNMVKDCYYQSNFLNIYLVPCGGNDSRGLDRFDGSSGNNGEIILHVDGNNTADFKDKVSVWL